MKTLTTRRGNVAALIVAGLMLVTFGIQASQARAGAPSYSAITNAVQAYVQKDAAARNFNLLSVQISTPQVQQTGTTVTLNYVATTTHTLNFASADDSPVVKGLHGFLANNPGLSVANKTSVESLLASWKARIQGYIVNPFTSNEFIEATASVDSGGNVIPGTIRVYFKNPDGGGLVPEAKALAEIPSNGVVQSRFASDPMGLAQPSSVSPQCVAGPSGCPYNAYIANNATSYADQHIYPGCTMTGTTHNCPGNPAYGGCIEWPTYNGVTYYNPSYWFSGKNGTTQACNDCANFVSQSLAQGGIPTVQGTTGWYEPPDGATPGNNAWINADDLMTYMTSHTDTGGVDYWVQLSSQSYVVPGDTLHYTDPTTGHSHVMIAVAGDGTSAYWDGHTYDDYHVLYGSTNTTFYQVSDWRN